MPDILTRLAQILEINGETIVRNGARVVGIWLLAWLAYRVVRLAASRIEAAVDDGDDSITTLRERRGKTISQLLRSVGRIVVFVIALLLTFNVFIDIGPILAGAGILGLAVSFGAQSLVKDVISGFFILFENQFAIGDVVEAGGQERRGGKDDPAGGRAPRSQGRDARDSQQRDQGGQQHDSRLVPGRGGRGRRLRRGRGSRAGGGAGRSGAVLHRQGVGAQLDGPVEVPGIESLGDSAIVIRSLIRTQPGSQWNAAREFRRRLKIRFDREQIEIPFPQRKVHVHVDDSTPERRLRAAGAAGG